MTEPQPIPQSPPVRAAGNDAVRAAIARAAQATGMDFDYLLAQAKIESSLDPTARAPTSSAAGLYQFTGGTWLETLDRHGADHGLHWAEAAIANGMVRDPGMRAHIMALRFDPDASAMMAAELARDNKAELSGVLGREPDAAELYLAHFLGSGGATRFLQALGASPGASAAALLPKAAGANRSIFYEANGAPRSVAGVMDVLRSKVAGAMNQPEPPAGSAWVEYGGDPEIPFPMPTQERIAGWSTAAWSPRATGGHSAGVASPPAAARPSMAETLAASFGLADASGSESAPAFVRAAYDRMRSFGL